MSITRSLYNVAFAQGRGGRGGFVMKLPISCKKTTPRRALWIKWCLQRALHVLTLTRKGNDRQGLDPIPAGIAGKAPTGCGNAAPGVRNGGKQGLKGLSSPSCIKTPNPRCSKENYVQFMSLLQHLSHFYVLWLIFIKGKRNTTETRSNWTKFLLHFIPSLI